LLGSERRRRGGKSEHQMQWSHATVRLVEDER
jgi:hypothetical protein